MYVDMCKYIYVYIHIWVQHLHMQLLQQHCKPILQQVLQHAYGNSSCIWELNIEYKHVHIYENVHTGAQHV